MTDVDILFAAIPVSDFAASTEWYARLFGRPADIVVHESEVMWRLADAAWCYVLHDDRRAGHTVVTLCVADLGQALAELATRGIASGPVDSIGDSARKATIADLDGNSVAFIEVDHRGGN